jgi:phage recombination protein Bet
MASRFGVEPNKMLATLKATAFRGEVSNEQMMALLIVAEQYHLNPWVKEIYAFPDKNNGIVPVVGVDGWLRILNEHPQFNGIEFKDGPVTKDGLPEWIECTIYRRDREHPIVTREYMAECKRATGPWSSHPRRLLRHKSLIQCARIAMSFVGIYDQDEAERIVEGEATLMPAASAEITAINEAVRPAETKADKAKRAEAKTEAADVVEITFAAIAERINAATTSDELDLVADLLRSLADEQQRAEADTEIRAKRKALA